MNDKKCNGVQHENMNPRYFPLGDHVVVIQYEKEVSVTRSQSIIAFSKVIEEANIEGIIQVIPTFCSIAVRYNPLFITYVEIVEILKELNAYMNVNLDEQVIMKKEKVIHIPVYYGEEYGPDLQYVSQKTGLTPEEVIKIHSAKPYYIYMLGVIGSFPYCGKLDKSLSIKRRSSPRVKIEKGSIVIANEQTIVITLESPSGWHVIGRTPLDTFNPDKESPVPFLAGDYIKFEPISKSLMENWNENIQSEWWGKWNS